MQFLVQLLVLLGLTIKQVCHMLQAPRQFQLLAKVDIREPQLIPAQQMERQ